MPNCLHKTRSLVKHLFGLMALPQQCVRGHRSYIVEMAPSQDGRRGTGRIPHRNRRVTNPRSLEPQTGSRTGSFCFPQTSPKCWAPAEEHRPWPRMLRHTSCSSSIWSARTPPPRKLLQHLRRGFPRTPSPKPKVFLGLIVIILTSDDLPRKTLDVIWAFTVWRILHGIVCSEVVQSEVREAVDAVKDPERHQGLHRIQVELREADVQVQQWLPEERVKR